MARKKRRSAWASILEVEPGARYRIRYWAKGPDGDYRRRSETVRGSRKDAEKRRAELMLDHSDDAPCPTVRQAWEQWCLPDLRSLRESGDFAPLSVRAHETAWRLHVEPTWGSVQLDAVRPLQVQQWLSGLTRSQAQTAMATLSRIMDYAVRYELVSHNPMREKYLLPSKSTIERADAGVWSLSDLEGVWDRVRGAWYEPAVLLAAFGGCRLGESLSPRASDVSRHESRGVELAVVSITGQIPPKGTDVVRPKTEQSARPVVLAGSPARRILSFAESMPDGWFLTNDGQGNACPQSRMKAAWRALRMEHPFRNLRNSWQTWMRWELRVQPHFIEPMMGHKLPGVTGAHYDRPQADVFCDVVAEAYLACPFDKDWGTWD